MIRYILFFIMLYIFNITATEDSPAKIEKSIDACNTEIVKIENQIKETNTDIASLSAKVNVIEMRGRDRFLKLQTDFLNSKEATDFKEEVFKTECLKFKKFLDLEEVDANKFPECEKQLKDFLHKYMEEIAYATEGKMKPHIEMVQRGQKIDLILIRKYKKPEYDKYGWRIEKYVDAIERRMVKCQIKDYDDDTITIIDLSLKRKIIIPITEISLEQLPFLSKKHNEEANKLIDLQNQEILKRKFEEKKEGFYSEISRILYSFDLIYEQDFLKGIDNYAKFNFEKNEFVSSLNEEITIRAIDKQTVLNYIRAKIAFEIDFSNEKLKEGYIKYCKERGFSLNYLDYSHDKSYCLLANEEIVELYDAKADLKGSKKKIETLQKKLQALNVQKSDLIDKHRMLVDKQKILANNEARKKLLDSLRTTLETDLKKICDDYFNAAKKDNNSEYKFWNPVSKDISHLYSVRKWEILNVGTLFYPYNEIHCDVTVQVESSTKGGMPIVKNWVLDFIWITGGWKINAINEK